MLGSVTTTTLAPPVAVGRRAVPRWWADLGGLLAGTSLLIVTALWVRNGGIEQVTAGGAGAVSALGRVT